MISFQVAELIEDTRYGLSLELIAGKKGLIKKITIPRIQKPGLALTGDTSHLNAGRIQIFGKSELSFLNSLSQKKIKEVIEKICKVEVAGIVITRNNPIPEPLVQEAEKRSIPLFSTPLLTTDFIHRVTQFLEDRLTASTTLHGVLVDILGVGVFIIGKSGIGKSECALDLILRGHRLVSDDIVEIRKTPPASLLGMGAGIIKHHMEIRGLGIINIKELFGVAATRDQKMIELVVELAEWNFHEESSYDRLGIDEQKYMILDTELPFLKIPVKPGRNMAVILEVAARNHLLKLKGFFPAREFQKQLNRELIDKAKVQENIWGLLE